MSTNFAKRKQQLGMDFGTASARLRKMLMYDLAKRLDLVACFVCHSPIDSVDDFTIEHKIPWLDNDPALFWDLENIAFSHARCNQPDRSRRQKPQWIHGGAACYERHRCRCDLCREWKSEKNRRSK